MIGAQWGDEGKGKIIDVLAEHFDVIARASGGANAGHTVVLGKEKHVFHLLPSGCLHEGKDIVLGSGMVLHLPTLLEEIHVLREKGIDVVPHLFISPAAHIVCAYHKELDALSEERRTQTKGEGIGTTRRGIGPAYTDKTARSGLRMELLWENAKTIRETLKQRMDEVKSLYHIDVHLEEEYDAVLAAKKLLERRLMTNMVDCIFSFLAEGKTFLLEGAQGTLLDIDHGTYPHVTSSSTTASGALQGLGLPPQAMTSCIGVAKAYCTRVGGGSFSTEVFGKVAERLRKRGGEYGATTGRPRRCGWLHLPSLQYAALLNGFTHWNITKIDVLDGERVVSVGVGVDRRGNVQYEELPGWEGSADVRAWEKLPKLAQKYLHFIERATGVPVAFVGTGERRGEMVVKGL